MKKIIKIILVSLVYINTYAQDAAVNYAMSINQKVLAAASNNYDVDVIGKWHNEALDYIFERAISTKLCYRDVDFENKFNVYLGEFLKTKGIRIQEGLMTKDTSVIHPQFRSPICGENNFSSAAEELLCRLNNLLSDFFQYSITSAELEKSCNKMLREAAVLENEIEQKIVGVTISVAKYTIQYWENNFDRLKRALTCSADFQLTKNSMEAKRFQNMKMFFNFSTVAGLSQQKKIPWGGIASSDVSGAIRGGQVGAVAAGGVPGAVAGAIMGAAVFSGIRLLTFAFFGN